MDQQRVAVIGASGFVGSAVVRAFDAAGWAVTPISAPRLRVTPETDPVMAAKAWVGGEPPELQALCEALGSHSIVVNAAGDASPTGAASPDMWGVNAVLPVVVAIVAERAGVGRFVHVSSAAVQGSQAELDELPYRRGHSPYARSKGAGEIALAALAAGATTIVVYRPTSVLGATRPIAQRLASVLSSRWLVVPRHDVPLPVSHVDHVGRAIVFLGSHPDPPPIALHPWEGMTVRSLAAAFGRQSPPIGLPKVVMWPALSVVRLLSKGGPVAGLARRVELLWAGQKQRSSMPALGFVQPDVDAAYEVLGRELLVHSPA